MKVTLVNHSDSKGGASVVTTRLLEALVALGIDARMLVTHKSTESLRIDLLKPEIRRKICFLYEHADIYLHNGLSRKNLFKISIANCGMDVHNHPWVQDADIVCLNWINQGTMSIKEIQKIKAPAVWTMHDMWCMTGVCHHAGECERFKSQCGNCPLLRDGKSSNDLSKSTHIRKQRLYAAKKIHFVAVSHWLAQKCAESALLKRQSVSVIPNAFPTDKFSPKPYRDRQYYHLDPNKPLVVMGAARLDDPIKGFDIAIEALNKAADTGIAAVLFGDLRDPSLLQRLKIPYTYVGQVTDRSTLNDLYAHSDIVLSTSHYETLPGTLIEGMAAGCVPVTFGNGGQSDIVDHLHTGYIASYPDADDIAKGIRFALSADIPDTRLREAVTRKFAAESVAKRYIALFESILDPSHKNTII